MHPAIQNQLNLQLSPADVLGEVLKRFSENEVQRINNLVGKYLPVETTTYSQLSQKYVNLKLLLHRVTRYPEPNEIRIRSLENQITELRKYRQLILKNMGE